MHASAKTFQPNGPQNTDNKRILIKIGEDNLPIKIEPDMVKTEPKQLLYDINKWCVENGPNAIFHYREYENHERQITSSEPIFDITDNDKIYIKCTNGHVRHISFIDRALYNTSRPGVSKVECLICKINMNIKNNYKCIVTEYNREKELLCECSLGHRFYRTAKAVRNDCPICSLVNTINALIFCWTNDPQEHIIDKISEKISVGFKAPIITQPKTSIVTDIMEVNLDNIPRQFAANFVTTEVTRITPILLSCTVCRQFFFVNAVQIEELWNEYLSMHVSPYEILIPFNQFRQKMEFLECGQHQKNCTPMDKVLNRSQLIGLNLALPMYGRLDDTLNADKIDMGCNLLNTMFTIHRIKTIVVSAGHLEFIRTYPKLIKWIDYYGYTLIIITQKPENMERSILEVLRNLAKTKGLTGNHVGHQTIFPLNTMEHIQRHNVINQYPRLLTIKAMDELDKSEKPEKSWKSGRAAAPLGAPKRSVMARPSYLNQPNSQPNSHYPTPSAAACDHPYTHYTPKSTLSAADHW